MTRPKAYPSDFDFR